MAAAPNWAKFIIICGGKGTGKSTFTDENIVKKTLYQNIIVLLKHIDTYNKPFSHLPLVPFYDYKGGKVRLDADDLRNNSITIDAFLWAMDKKFRNGLLIIDEGRLYPLADKNGDPIPPFMEILKQARKYNVTVILLYHGLIEIPIRFLTWANDFILFHQTSKFAHKGHMLPEAEDLYKMAARIRNQYLAGNIHYCERLKLL